VLQLPDVAELVDDQVLADLLQRRPHEDQRAELVAVEAPQDRQPEEPRRVEDAHAPRPHRPGVEVECRQSRGGAAQQLALM
jgi:hypothetical protein